MSHSPRLPWLGDVFAIPRGWPLANVFSIGDVVIVVAVGYFAHMVCRRAPVRPAQVVGEPLVAAG